MKWLLDEEGDLVNVALAQFISLSPVEGHTVADNLYCVVAIFPRGDSTWLYSGSEDDCRSFLNGLAGRLLS